jgi:hypothetical protein
MNTYDHFRFSLQTEFKRKAHPQVRALWADLEELGEARDEQARTTALRQVHRRVCVLEYAAHAVDAHELRAVSNLVLCTLGGIGKSRLATQPELFTTLEQTMTKLADALHSIEAETPAFESDYQPTRAAFVGSPPD